MRAQLQFSRVTLGTAGTVCRGRADATVAARMHTYLLWDIERWRTEERQAEPKAEEREAVVPYRTWRGVRETAALLSLVFVVLFAVKVAGVVTAVVRAVCLLSEIRAHRGSSAFRLL